MGVLKLDFEERTEKRLNNHSGRIRTLEIQNAAQNEKIDMLCKKLDSLSDKIGDLVNFLKTCMWKLLAAGGTVFLVFLGFFVWYVQRLGD